METTMDRTQIQTQALQTTLSVKIPTSLIGLVGLHAILNVVKNLPDPFWTPTATSMEPLWHLPKYVKVAIVLPRQETIRKKTTLPRMIHQIPPKLDVESILWIPEQDRVHKVSKLSELKRIVPQDVLLKQVSPAKLTLPPALEVHVFFMELSIKPQKSCPIVLGISKISTASSTVSPFYL